MVRLVTVLVALAVVAAWPLTAAAQARHVRVILDTSGSMAASRTGPGNDPGRLAILATALLRDLARPSDEYGDTFEVIPFDKDYGVWNGSGPPPPAKSPRIVSKMHDVEDFSRRLNALRYDARHTYFYPGLNAAVEDFERMGSEGFDTRTIVLLTDGVSNWPGEIDVIRRDLARVLQELDIALYVVAFGSQANDAFFEQLVQGTAAGSINKLWRVSAVDQLPEVMMEIFERSFGYTRTRTRAMSSPRSLELNDGSGPPAVAVVALTGVATPPQLEFQIGRARVNEDVDWHRSEATAGGAYRVRWVLTPEEGAHPIATSPGSRVWVLRHAPVEIEVVVVPAGPGRSTKLIAGERTRVQVKVRSPHHHAVQFSLYKESTSAEKRFTHATGAEPGSSVVGDSRVYDLMVEFPVNDADPSQMYPGFLEVVARRESAVMGHLSGERAHRIEVHPPLRLSPSPSRDVYPENVQAGDSACSEFTFDVNGYPPEALTGYSMDLELDPLTGIRYALNGSELELKAGRWSGTLEVPREEIETRRHELCATMGRDLPRVVAEHAIGVRFTLREDPYDSLGAVAPFEFVVRLELPPWWQRWAALGTLATALVAALLALWYTRPRPNLPVDLRYAIWPERGLLPQPRRPGDAWGPGRLLGLAERRPVFLEEDAKPVAWIRAVRPGLFRVDARGDARLERAGREADEAREAQDRSEGRVEVCRDYRLVTPARGRFWLRLQYATDEGP